LKKQWLFAVLAAIAFLHTANVLAADVVSVAVDDLVTGRASLPESGVVSMGQPNGDALKIAADAGYATVIDLRGTDENRGLDEKAAVEALGMQYLSLPIENKAAVNYDNAAQLDKLLAGQDKPVLLHCGSGNRVGALIALREKLHGATNEEALAKGKVAGLTSLEPVVRERLADSPAQ
jgi:uncharacterized protein (TIGR01244 family)